MNKNFFNKIVVMGLGYIGLPTAAMLAFHRKKVLGVDINPDIVNKINQGKIHITEPGLLQMIQTVVSQGHLKAALQPQAAEAFLIAVPTPCDENQMPDLSYINATIRAIAPVLNKGNIVILESTSPVGTTEKISQQLAQLRPDLVFPHQHPTKQDVYIAYCPERVLPGKVFDELVNNHRIIGGISECCALKAKALYQIFVKGKCLITNARTAEMAKLTENSFRDVNIAFANELSIICEKHGINVWELIKLSNYHPRVNILQPGPGVGGHCIAVDPWFIVANAPAESVLIKTARKVNDGKPQYVIKKILEQCKDRSKVKLTCLGLSFKPDTEDFRESPALKIIEALSKHSHIELDIVEPHLHTLPAHLSQHPQINLISMAQAYKNSGLLICLVKHQKFINNKNKILTNKEIILDFVNLLPAHQKPSLPKSMFNNVKNLFFHAIKKLKPLIAFKRKTILKNKIITFFDKNGLEATEKMIRKKIVSPKELANSLLCLAKLIQNFDFKNAVRLGNDAYKLAPTPFLKKWLGFREFDLGNIQKAQALMQDFLPNNLRASEKHRMKYIEGVSRLYTQGIDLPKVQSKYAYEPIAKRVLYIAASILPFHTSGYTIRTHHILKGLCLTDWEVICIARPGYPNDRNDSECSTINLYHELDGIKYNVLTGPHRRKCAYDHYLIEASNIIENKIRELKPALIQAASNYENALPALIAARRLGVPFIYEVRGLWELSRASKIPGYQESELFYLEQSLEKLVSCNADRVFTLGKNLSDELINRGVNKEKIYLTPNAINPEHFKLDSKDIALAKKLSLNDKSFVIGYVGSILHYEGLDDLITAFHTLQNEIPHGRLIIVGDGEALSSLQQQSQKLGLEKKVYFTGKLQYHEVTKYYTLFDMIALPRKNHLVCQLVTPLKPFEAMCMGIPLVVSDVNALSEIVEDNKTALICHSNNPTSLAAAILRLALDPALRQKIATQARRAVLENNTWNKVCGNIALHYSDLLDTKKEAINIKYEGLALPRPENPDEIIKTGWKRENYPAVHLDNVPWELKSETERSWNFNMHCWNILEKLLATYSQEGQLEYLNASLKVALDWVEKHKNSETENISPFAWYDMAVGLRSYRLAYIIDACETEKILTLEMKILLWNSLEQHRAYLANDHNIAFHSNHGFYQIGGQLAMGRRFASRSLLYAEAYEQSLKRLKDILEKQFTQEGVHREHSPDYHYMLCSSLIYMINNGLIKDRQMIINIEKAEEALSWFIRPHGYICNFGDSNDKKISPGIWRTAFMQYITGQVHLKNYSLPQYKAFSESGYFIVRILPDSENVKPSYLAQAAAFHSRTHKQADDLSFIWSDQGHDIIIDAGRYGYIGKTKTGSEAWLNGNWYSDPNRIYCESTRAHNTLEFDGQDYPRRKTKPYGSAIKRWLNTPDSIFAVETEVKHFGSIRHARVLVFKPSHWLLVFDWYHDNNKNPHCIKQWFHFDPKLQLSKDETSYEVLLPGSEKPLKVISLLQDTSGSRLYYGEKEPLMQGWSSKQERQITPAYAFCYEQTNKITGIFATLFSFSNYLKPNFSQSKTNISGHSAILCWQDELGDHKLKLTRYVDKDFEIEYVVK